MMHGNGTLGGGPVPETAKRIGTRGIAGETVVGRLPIRSAAARLLRRTPIQILPDSYWAWNQAQLT